MAELTDAAVAVQPGGRRRIELALPLAIVIIDQVTKAMIRTKLPLHESVSIIPGFLDFTHVLNTGAAFGFLNGADFPYKTTAIAIIATAALVGVSLYSVSLSRHQVAARVGLALIVGGAAGNLVDRLMLGWVVDFVDVYWRDYHFWAFNVADSAITIGVTIMIVDMLRSSSHVSTSV